jgi:sugar/nucleoside kinase (ribokinase family)
MADIACLGLLVADTVGKPIDALPARGTLELVERIELHSGGCAANTAVALAKIGVSTAILGKVGADGFGEFLTGAMAKHGLDTRGLVQDTETATAATMVVVHSDAERSFLHVAGANAVYGPDDVNWDVVGAARVLHVAGLQLLPTFEGEPLAGVLREAKRSGLTTTLDTVMNPRSPWWDGIAPALPFLDWALPSFEEAVLLTGEIKALRQARKLQDGGAKNVAIKMGKDGCLVAPADEKAFHVAPLTVEAVDALGAGDAWVAGFLTGLLHNWPLDQTARFANAVGACCVQSLGATTGIKPLDETLQLMKGE